MALMFSRLARNFIKNGYFPTDEETLLRTLQAIAPASTGEMRIFDPCAGEGTALAECQHHLGKSTTETFGIEYDEERAWHAKQLLNRCIHADFMRCVISPKSMGLLFLNPPYGDLVADQLDLGNRMMKGRQRLEKLFYRQAIPYLQPQGILAFIIPAYVLDTELAQWIAQQFNEVQIYRAATDRFQQVVILGKRRLPGDQAGGASIKQHLIEVGQGKSLAELPMSWIDKCYEVPAKASTTCKFFTTQLEPKQLVAELPSQTGLWSQFDGIFSKCGYSLRPSLMDLSSWHLALALAAGQVSGIVRATEGRTWVIKGDTLKTQEKAVDYTVNAKDEVIETITLLDRFVPMIQALDMTAHSPTFGHVLTIQ